MNPFSYLSYLTSIVLALSITRILTGVGRLLQVRGHIHIYWVHLLWALNLFLFAVLSWWILYRWQTQAQWTFFLFLFVLLSPTVSFLESVLLFPDEMGDRPDLKHHFYANHRWFFALAALLPIIDAADTLLKGWDHFVAQGVIYPVSMALLFVGSAIAALTRNERYHEAYAIFFLVYLVAFIGINLRVLA